LESIAQLSDNSYFFNQPAKYFTGYKGSIMSNLTTIIVDDDPICLANLQLMTRLIGLEPIASFRCAETALAELEFINPDIAILDECLGGMNGCQAATIIRKKWSKVITLVITCSVNPVRLSKIWLSGVHGLAEKGTHHELKEAVDMVMKGHRYLDKRCAQRVDSSKFEGFDEIPYMFDILEHLTRGKKYWEIAHILGLSEHTIRTYVKRIMAFTDIHDKAALTRYAMSNGLVDYN